MELIQVTKEEVKQALLKKNHILARRWSRDDDIILRLVEFHNGWNRDHFNMKQFDMVYGLDDHLDYYLDVPYSIDRNIKPPV